MTAAPGRSSDTGKPGESAADTGTGTTGNTATPGNGTPGNDSDGAENGAGNGRTIGG